MIACVLHDPDVVGDLDLGDLPTRWRKVDFVIREVRRVTNERDPLVVDARAVDESRPGGHRLYPAAERYLSGALDCHTALPKLLEAHGATQVAMWALLRAQFEAAFMALWLLEPEDSVSRVLRGVRVEWLDDRQSHAYFREILTDLESTLDEEVRVRELARHERLLREHDRTFRDECQRLGRSWLKPLPINVVEELGLMQVGQSLEWRVLLRHTWRSLAGLQHGSVGALLRVSDKVELEPLANATGVRLSPSDSSFQTLGEATALLTMQAFARYQACHRPTNSNGFLDLDAVASLRREWNSL